MSKTVGASPIRYRGIISIATAIDHELLVDDGGAPRRRRRRRRRPERRERFSPDSPSNWPADSASPTRGGRREGTRDRAMPAGRSFRPVESPERIGWRSKYSRRKS